MDHPPGSEVSEPDNNDTHEAGPVRDAEPDHDGRRRVDPGPEVVVSVELDAAPDDVWQALTTDAGLGEWIGAGSTIGTAPGDELRFNDRVSGEAKRGFLDEVTPRRRLGYTWWPETAPERSTRVAITLEPHHAGTRVTVVESRPMPARGASARIAGRNATCSTLAATMSDGRADWEWRAAVLVLLVSQRMPPSARVVPLLRSGRCVAAASA